MKKAFISGALWAAPIFAFAQGQANPGGTLESLVRDVVGPVVNLLVPLVSTLAVVFFFYGLAKYILNSGDEDKRKEGKDIMIWGILAMFVLVTIWGIIAFIQRTLGTTGGPVGARDIYTPGVGQSCVGGICPTL